MEAVNALLAVAAFTDDDVCLMSLNFWHRLSRHLTDDGLGSLSVDGAAGMTLYMNRVHVYRLLVKY